MRRSFQLSKLQSHDEEWDLVVIGGGATGLAVALDAATRGLSVVLLEQADYAESTSSKSTKLIHGGVRYLRRGEVSLVRESLHERGRLLRNAPNFVTPLPFLVPAYRWYDRAFYGAGLALYDVLSGNLAIGRTRHFSREEAVELSPNLNRKGLRGGTHYWDAQFDDSRLAVAFARTAERNGAVVLNHFPVTGLIKEQGKIRGVAARDKIGGGEYEIRARVVVNATGVFTDSIRKMDKADAPEIVMPSQGIHIVLEESFLQSDAGIMIPETDDGRVLFAIPWHNRVLLGTTDTPGVPVEINPQPLDEEIDYLLEHAARYLEKAPERGDIKASFAGLRPLVRPPQTSGEKTSKFSRKHALLVSDSGMLTITGGKWTTCRAMAEAAVDRAEELAGWSKKRCRTQDLPLLDDAEEKIAELINSEPELSEPLDPDLPYLLGHVIWAIREEQAETVEDVLARRTRCRFLDEAASERCTGTVAGWLEKEKKETLHAGS